MKKKKINCGSAVIEITLLIPVFIGCIYFYIILMLFFVHQAEVAGKSVATLYASDNAIENEDGSNPVNHSGNMSFIKAEIDENGLKASLEYKKDDLDVVKNLRRWQLVADTIQ